MNMRTKKITTLAMFAAIAFLVAAFGRFFIVPSAPFLDYEAKDVIVTIAGFIFGPLSAAVVAVIVSFVEMITISSTGFIGFVMNILGSCAFACVAASFYKRKRTLSWAIVGLLAGCVAMTIVMLLWNYLITPLYMGVPRDEVSAMLVPVFLPFNLIKGGLNAAVTMLLYKPVVTTLRKAHLIGVTTGKATRKRWNIGVIVVSALAAASLVMAILVWNGVI